MCFQTNNGYIRVSTVFPVILLNLCCCIYKSYLKKLTYLNFLCDCSHEIALTLHNVLHNSPFYNELTTAID